MRELTGSYKNYSFVHNGTIRGFENIRRALISELDDRFFLEIKAQTDSEHLFFLIMQILHSDPKCDLKMAVMRAFKWVEESQAGRGEDHFSKLNIVITDGSQLVATRCALKDKNFLSLYYSVSREDNSVIIASEELSDYKKDWNVVPESCCLVVDKSLGITLENF